MRYLAALLAALFLTGPALAQGTSELRALRTLDDVRAWQAVGRLDIAGRAFCTGALIDYDLVLTAAHCTYDESSGRQVAPGALRFRAGLRDGSSAGERRAAAYVTHPGFAYNGADSSDRVATDLALIRLDAPISSGVFPFATADRPRKGDFVGVVSYGGSRAERPALQEACRVLARRRGMLMMNCDVELGSSGAPIFSGGADGRPAVVSVISSMTEIDGRRIALGADLQAHIDLLRDLLAGPAQQVQAAPGKPAVRRLTGSGAGAKFVRP